MTLIILARKIQDDYQSKVRAFSQAKRAFYQIGYVLFWIVVIVLITLSTINDFSIAIDTLEQRNNSISETYVAMVSPYIPQAVQERISHEEILQRIEGMFAGFFRSLLASFSNFALTALIVIPFMFYTYFSQRKHFKESLLYLIPRDHRKGVHIALIDIKENIKQFIDAKIIESIWISLICCFGFYIIGLKAWLFLGLLAGFLNIIPYAGPVLGAILPILFGLLDDPIVGLYALFTIVIAQIIDNMYIIPFVVADRVRINAFLSIILILVGAEFFGAIGMVFSIPVYLVYKIVLRESYEEFIRIHSKDARRR